MHSNLSSHHSNSNPSSANANTNPLSSLHRTLTPLQAKFESLNMSIQPKLNKARYKAEAGIARRGFIPASHAREGAHGGGFRGEGEKEGLMHDDYGGEGWRERESKRERSGRGMRGSEDSVGMDMDMDAGGPDVDLLPEDEDPRTSSVGGVGGGIGARGREKDRIGGEGGTGGGERGVEDILKWPVGPGEEWRPL